MTNLSAASAPPSSPERLQQRHQEALAFAYDCAAILTEHYHAEQVIPFGLVVGDAPGTGTQT